jgi:predicted dehydrogenase
MVGALRAAGGVCKYVYDPDPKKVEGFLKAFPDVEAVSDFEKILQDPKIHMVASAGVPNTRAKTGMMVMHHDKDYFVDKTPFTSLSQLDEAKAVCAKTGRRYMVYYSERLHSEGSIYAGQLVEAGAIGQVIQVLGLGPHRLNAPSRPDWFFVKEQYGGILCDIGSHQVEQFLFYSGAKDAKVLHSKVGNYGNPGYPELEDYGDATLLADNGATNYFRVDWFTPKGLQAWGDGRLIIMGTKGTIEVRKNINFGVDTMGNHVYLANETDETHINVEGKVGCPFFGELILDTLNRTENAMTQAHAFKAAELCMKAQGAAIRI